MRFRALSALLLAALLTSVSCSAPAQDCPSVSERDCTFFCLDNGDYSVFATNYDNRISEGALYVNKRGVTKTGWEAGTGGKYARWTAEYASVTFSLAGIQMAWAGMNQAGLAISTMWLRGTQAPSPDERPPLVSALWVQYQLDTCATVGEVMTNVDRVRIVDTVDHYLVCDRTGACAAVEFLDGETIFHTGEAMPVNVLVSHAYPVAVAAWQSASLGDDNSLQRFGIAADRVTAYRLGDATTAVAYAFETLEQVSGQTTRGSPTQWSIVFDTETMRVHWRTSQVPQERSVDFARLDLDCGTPAAVLDVHAPLSGDVSEALGTFTFRDNLRQTQRFLREWGNLAISPLEVEVLERGIASFPCERPAAPYQEEATRVVPPLVGWVALALLHRVWPAAGILALGVGILVVLRARAGRQGTRDGARE